MKGDEFRQYIYKICLDEIQSGKHNAQREEWFRWQAEKADMEYGWVRSERPYYNIWPIVIPLSQSIRLDVPMKHVELPFSHLLLRFALGHEPHGIGTAILLWDSEDHSFIVHCDFANSTEGLYLSFGQYGLDQTFEHYLERAGKNPGLSDWSEEREQACNELEASSLMVRLAVFVALLSRGEDMITPLVLSKDRRKYEETDDPEVKKWLEDRAARRGAGRGFNVGKKLQEQKEKSPHWRNPHLALFWTGKGRTKPIIKMRSGAVIQRASMAEVPTGYLGPETEEEDKIDEDVAQHEPVPKPKRFEIMKRDGYKCQLCGRSQDDGVKLQVDHRVPRAKGGSNDDDNLWTLCDECNLGKSDRDL